ncbi:MAG: alpha/beta hydrolase [Zoogloeaceae bacterium]|jgi:pimeloyl-ACP methyl ester carboxylesterase|nr:alpha/beta hydrolase [Zoogloeaceae bacterium]
MSDPAQEKTREIRARLCLFSGLGADERVFQFLDFSGWETTSIRWIKPEPMEPIAHYARRLLAQIPDAPSILLGVSFGGMVAVEVAKLIAAEQVILISSAATRQDLPIYTRLAKILNMRRCLPMRWLTIPNPLTAWLFGAQTPAERKLLADILRDTDPAFLSWAIEKILNWENTWKPENLVRLHGARDRILPARHADFEIAGGGHFMAVNRAAEISGILREKILPQ